MDQKYELNARFQLDQIRPLEVTTQVYSFSKEAMRKQQVNLPILVREKMSLESTMLRRKRANVFRPKLGILRVRKRLHRAAAASFAE